MLSKYSMYSKWNQSKDTTYKQEQVFTSCEIWQMFDIWSRYEMLGSQWENSNLIFKTASIPKHTYFL